MTSNPPIRLGYKASAEQFGPTELLSFSLLAERLGFDDVAASDHFQPGATRAVTARPSCRGSARWVAAASASAWARAC